MITYGDKTFCSFWQDCIAYPEQDCPKALTEEIVRKAIKVELPICQYLEKPDCFEDKKE